MEIIILIAFLAIIIAIGNAFLRKPSKAKNTNSKANFTYSRKSSIMTDREAVFYKRLCNIANDRYVVFPQIHLSSLAQNKTTGKYYKLGFQRINRRSVDYVLADINTLQPIYAVELDDRTHDTTKGQYVDSIKAEVLKQIGMPLVRFRDVENMRDEDIVDVFENAKETRRGDEQ